LVLGLGREGECRDILEYSKQFKLSGHPACKKQLVVCTRQFVTAVLQEPPSLKGGRGLEHHFPHLYSQVGIGVTVTVDVHNDGGVVLGGVVVLDVVDEVVVVETGGGT
jgi:hypothetical protein